MYSLSDDDRIELKEPITIQIASDLHLEVNETSDKVNIPNFIVKENANVLILAGDIGSLYKTKQLSNFLWMVSKMYKLVIYVPGNHEYYKIKDYPELHYHRLINKLRHFSDNIQNLRILNRNRIFINEYCFAGCTLWSDTDMIIPEYIVKIKNINEIYRNLYKNDLKFVKNSIELCQKKNKKLIMITHHCPTYKCLGTSSDTVGSIGSSSEGERDNTHTSNYREKYSSLYASKLDSLLSKNLVEMWICGHIHKNFDFISDGGTRVIGNQKGKKKDNILDYSKCMEIVLS
jgi:UDP-2,3-diacylglucosamine pyrophosphatase LpxH